jgi:hypothetical protein
LSAAIWPRTSSAAQVISMPGSDRRHQSLLGRCTLKDAEGDLLGSDADSEASSGRTPEMCLVLGTFGAWPRLTHLRSSSTFGFLVRIWTQLVSLFVFLTAPPLKGLVYYTVHFLGSIHWGVPDHPKSVRSHFLSPKSSLGRSPEIYTAKKY